MSAIKIEVTGEAATLLAAELPHLLHQLVNILSSNTNFQKEGDSPSPEDVPLDGVEDTPIDRLQTAFCNLVQPWLTVNDTLASLKYGKPEWLNADRVRELQDVLHSDYPGATAQLLLCLLGARPDDHQEATRVLDGAFSLLGEKGVEGEQKNEQLRSALCEVADVDPLWGSLKQSLANLKLARAERMNVERVKRLSTLMYAHEFCPDVWTLLRILGVNPEQHIEAAAVLGRAIAKVRDTPPVQSVPPPPPPSAEDFVKAILHLAGMPGDKSFENKGDALTAGLEQVYWRRFAEVYHKWVGWDCSDPKVREAVKVVDTYLKGEVAPWISRILQRNDSRAKVALMEMVELVKQKMESATPSDSPFRDLSDSDLK